MLKFFISMVLKIWFWNLRAISWDGLKGLILRRCGKLNSTHTGKLQLLQYMSRSTWDTFYPSCTTACVLRLMYCSDLPWNLGCQSTQAAVHELWKVNFSNFSINTSYFAAVHKLDAVHKLECSCSCTAANSCTVANSCTAARLLRHRSSRRN